MPNPKLETYKNKETNTVYDLTDPNAQASLTAILDGTDIDSFGDVETALTDKVDIKALSQNKETGDTASAGYNVNSYIWIEKLTNAFGSHLFKVTQKVNEGDSWASIKSTKLTDATACGEIKDLRNAVSTNESAISAIKDGTTIDSFGDVETALDDYFPRSEQAVLGAVNLLDNKAPTATENGITYTVNADKSVTISGTATAESRTRIWPNLGSFLDQYKGKTLYLSAGLPSDAPNDYFLNLVQKQGNTDLSSINVVGGEISFTVDSRTDNLYIAFIVKNGTNLSTPITIKPQITLAPNTPYAPYAMTNKELTEKVQGIINAATNAADFAAFKTAIGNL